MSVRYRKYVPALRQTLWYRKLSAPQPNAQSLVDALIVGTFTGVIPGLIHIGLAGLHEKMRWKEFPLQQTRDALQAVIEAGAVAYDPDAEVLWFPTAFEGCEPEQPQIIRAWEAYWAEIPDCALKVEAWHYFQEYFQSLITNDPKTSKPHFLKTFEEVCEHPANKRQPSGQPIMYTTSTHPPTPADNYSTPRPSPQSSPQGSPPLTSQPSPQGGSQGSPPPSSRPTSQGGSTPGTRPGPLQDQDQEQKQDQEQEQDRGSTTTDVSTSARGTGIARDPQEYGHGSNGAAGPIAHDRVIRGTAVHLGPQSGVAAAQPPVQNGYYDLLTEWYLASGGTDMRIVPASPPGEELRPPEGRLRLGQLTKSDWPTVQAIGGELPPHIYGAWQRLCDRDKPTIEQLRKAGAYLKAGKWWMDKEGNGTPLESFLDLGKLHLRELISKSEDWDGTTPQSRRARVNSGHLRPTATEDQRNPTADELLAAAGIGPRPRGRRPPA